MGGLVGCADLTLQLPLSVLLILVGKKQCICKVFVAYDATWYC